MPRILSAAEGHNITLLSQYSWQDENILLPQLYTSAFGANNEEARLQYEEHYTHFFGTEHSEVLPRYDMLGYDLTRQLIAWMRGEEYHGVQSEIEFQKVSEEGGFLNQHVEIVHK